MEVLVGQGRLDSKQVQSKKGLSMVEVLASKKGWMLNKWSLKKVLTRLEVLEERILADEIPDKLKVT